MERYLLNMKLRQSLLIKILLILLAFISSGITSLCGKNVLSYLNHYSMEATSYTDTSQFEQLYLKYAERTAVYINYKENGFVADPNSIYYTSDLLSMLNGSAKGNLRPSDSVYTASQESFEYYNRLLNYYCKSFYYYVKNTTTGEYYYSPHFADLLKSKDESVDLNDTTFEKYLETISTFPAYLVINTKNSRYITNVENKFDSSINDSSIDWIVDFITNKYNITLNTTENSSETVIANVENGSDDYVIYTFVRNADNDKNDEFYNLYEDFHTRRSSYEINLKLGIVSGVFFLLSLIGLGCCIGYKKGTSKIYLNSFDKLHTELAVIILASCYLFSIFILTNIYQAYRLRLYDILWMILYFIITFTFFMIGFDSLFKRLKTHTLYKNSVLHSLCDYLFVKGFQKIKDNIRSFTKLLIHRHVAIRLLFLLMTFGILQGIAFLIAYRTPLVYVFLVFLIFCYLGLSLIKTFSDMNILIQGTKKIANGDLNAKIPAKQLSEPSKTIAKSINRIGDGLSNAVEEKLKSERLKTELITNVSHDIKTPLTSIINYVDLLNKEHLDNEKANSYLAILTEKSWRLKTLIEDLVEASKASSGALSLNLERLNIVELIKQALGEFNDRFSANNLETVFQISEENIYILGDGRSTYRIIENLFSNVNKYALQNTRVYIDVSSTNKNAIIQVKNISAGKLGISGDELMERFVRGDLSRNSEGSGLGLSIAKSLAALQNGDFDIILDGDLFKAVVKLPIFHNENLILENVKLNNFDFDSLNFEGYYYEDLGHNRLNDGDRSDRSDRSTNDDNINHSNSSFDEFNTSSSSNHELNQNKSTYDELNLDDINFHNLNNSSTYDEPNLDNTNFHELNNSSTSDEVNLNNSNSEIKNFNKSIRKCKFK